MTPVESEIWLTANGDRRGGGAGGELRVCTPLLPEICSVTVLGDRAACGIPASARLRAGDDVDVHRNVDVWYRSWPGKSSDALMALFVLTPLSDVVEVAVEQIQTRRRLVVSAMRRDARTAESICNWLAWISSGIHRAGVGGLDDQALDGRSADSSDFVQRTIGRGDDVGRLCELLIAWLKPAISACRRCDCDQACRIIGAAVDAADRC